MERVNVFIISRDAGARRLWSNVPIETAKRLCSLKETMGEHFMMVWSFESELGYYRRDPMIDDGRFDHLLTDDEKKTILKWDGKQWVKKIKLNNGV